MVNPGREPIPEGENNNKINQDNWKTAKNKVNDKIKEKGNKNLAQIIEETTAKELAKTEKIEAWKSAFPELKSELTALKQKAKDFLQEDDYVPTPRDYFRRNSNGTDKFKPDLLAQELIEDFHFKYIEDTETLYVYDDKYWQDRGERLVKNEANKRLGEEYEPHYANKTIDAIKDREKISFQKKNFRPCKYKIPFKDCTYNLKTNQKEQHNPEDNFTHIIPYELDRDAQCPKISDFLDTVLENKRDKELILETMGYTLLADMPYGHALLLNGEGKNGKSVLLQVWKKMIGEDNYKEEELQQLENGRFATRWLYRKLGLFSDDMSSERLESGNTLKSLTGGGDTRAEIKGGDHFEFQNFATPVFACNDIPESNDDSEGFYRRWEIVNFPYKFVDNPVRDNEKEQKPKDQLVNSLTSKEEMRGLINEALTRLEMIKENGGFYNKTQAEDTRSLWRSYSSPLEQFVENCLEQGLTPNDIDDLERESSDTNLQDYGYDFVIYDDLHWLVKKYCEYYGARPPTKTHLTQYLKNQSPYFTQVGRTRRISDDEGRTKVYKFIRYSEEFVNFLRNEGEMSECPYFFQNLCAHAKKTQQDISKTPDTRTDNSSTSIGQSIRDFVTSQRQELVDKQELIDELDFNEDKIEEKINQLEHDGEIYEPRPGKLQKV